MNKEQILAEIEENEKKRVTICNSIESLNQDVSKINSTQNILRAKLADILDKNAITLNDRVVLYLNDHNIPYGYDHHKRRMEFLRDLGFGSDGGYTETGQTVLSISISYDKVQKIHNSILTVLPHMKKLHKGSFPDCYVFSILEATLSQYSKYSFVVCDNDSEESKYTYSVMKDTNCLIETDDLELALMYIADNHPYYI